jgi:hypothetical protein
MSRFPLSPEIEIALKIVLSGTCEWCGRVFSFDQLEVHLLLPERDDASESAESPDPQKRFLLLCRECHQDLHRTRLPLRIQKDLVRARSMELKRAIRKVLGYTPEPYQPPGDFDLAEIYEECFSLRALDLYRAGG